MLRIRNWAKFQHFKDRKPPWVKLYRDILDDLEWHELEPQAAKILVMLWLIASEDEGRLPNNTKLAFRLRISEKSLETIVSKLLHWLEHDDISAISQQHQDDTLETEGETYTTGERDLASSDESLSAAKGIHKSAPNGEAVALIPIVGGKEFGVSKEFAAELAELYPNVDVPQTLREIRGWNLANPKRQKTLSGVSRHINQWMQKEQNHG